MIGTIILLVFIGAVSYAYFKELSRVERFRRNIHQGDTVKCKLGHYLFMATIEKIPGSQSVVLTDLTYNQRHIVSINSIYPL